MEGHFRQKSETELFRLNKNGNQRPILHRKPSSVASEMYLTELKYIEDLSIIVNDYIPQMYSSDNPIEMPEDLKYIKAEKVFGNVESIYNWHKNDFLTILRRCLKDPTKFGVKMEEIEKTMLGLYVNYFKNKPVSEYIVKTHEKYFSKFSEHFRNSFQIKSYLQIPICRIFQYKLLFLSILKLEPKYEKELTKAIDVMERIISDVNDLMVLWRLEKFPEKIDDQGKLICHDPLFCIELYESQKSLWRNIRMEKPKRFQVFLLEGSIIFANIIGEDNSFNLVPYEYHYHIKVVQIKRVERYPDRILLKFEDPKDKDLIGYTIFTNDKDMNKKWYHAITAANSRQENFEKSILTPV